MVVVTLEVVGRVGFNHDFGLGESKEAKLIIQGWHEQASVGLQPSGFAALVVLRIFPYISPLPVWLPPKEILIVSHTWVCRTVESVLYILEGHY